MAHQATAVPSLATSSLADRLFFRGDAGYEEARVGRIWHGRAPDRFPDAVLMAETEADLVEAVRLARSRGWQIAVRAGGHSFPFGASATVA